MVRGPKRAPRDLAVVHHPGHARPMPLRCQVSGIADDVPVLLRCARARSTVQHFSGYHPAIHGSRALSGRDELGRPLRKVRVHVRLIATRRLRAGGPGPPCNKTNVVLRREGSSRSIPVPSDEPRRDRNCYNPGLYECEQPGLSAGFARNERKRKFWTRTSAREAALPFAYCP
jgi:hypothetical protein